MIRKMNFEDTTEALQVLTLQLASYIREAEIIGFEDIPPLKDSVETLRKSDEIFCGCFEDGELAGCIAYKRLNRTVDICRVMVHPAHFRKGIASRLIRYVQEAESDASRFAVTAVTSNLPAIRLYDKHGFSKRGETEIAPGIMLAAYVKEKGANK